MTEFAIMKVFPEIFFTFWTVIHSHMIVFVAIVPFLKMLSNIGSAPWTPTHSTSHPDKTLRFILIRFLQSQRRFNLEKNVWSLE